ncbi:MAG: carbohydrate binding domain-containing protein [Phocaeicola sp.]|nr:carbohydrate binding domain-containing protein [Phocaeicola sp.]MDY5939024.1 carbohydrate binding domain-containing protein [Phocaeicola sp.]
MEKMYKYFLTIVIFISALLQVKAQNVTNGNIIPNGGFETWIQGTTLRPAGWIIGNSLSPEQVKGDLPSGSKGLYALKIWANGGGISLTDEVPVESKKKYIFSFWHKGSKSLHAIKVYFSWYHNGSYKKREQKLSVRTTETWKKEEAIIEVPEDANKVGIELTPATDYSGVGISFDDVSLIATENTSGETSSPEAPKNMKINVFQGEMEISWDKPANSKDMKWEVVFDGKKEGIVSGNSYMKTKLKPNSKHNIKVRSVKDGKVSAYIEKEATTEKMEESELSPNRIPYLRTINPDGSCKGRFLKLYYNELANPNAEIRYKLNGMPVTPLNDTLEFPAFKGDYNNFQLEIYINEGEGREWEILYNGLSVQNN